MKTSYNFLETNNKNTCIFHKLGSDKMNIKYGTQTIEFTVEYRNRKTYEIGIKPPDTIKVKVPKHATEDQIKKIVMSKAKWIIKKLLYFKEIDYRKPVKEYINGESFLYCGTDYLLQIIDDSSVKKPITKIEQEKFIVYTNTRDQEKIKTSMKEWYKNKTFEKVVERIEYFQRYFNVKPNTIKAKEQKKRWASCSSKRNLMFNWRCIMAPVWVLDYIVVHEMCHMVHMNHSKDFWCLVEKIIPDYKKRKEWLKNYGIRMDL